MLGVYGSEIRIIFWHFLGFEVYIIYAILLILVYFVFIYVILLMTIV